MSAASLHLGYAVGSGDAVDIPIAHMLITGVTQQAGKTTTLEALVSRHTLRAVTFITKRGEQAFKNGRRMPPYFRERADWVFVSSLIDATLGEKNKLLRAWLMKVCRNTKTLAEVLRNVREAKASARGFSESIYTEIEGYLDLVVPQIANSDLAYGITIGPGLNVTDLSPYSTELQALVIRSVLEHVYQREQNVITVIPEAWEFLPEGRGSPVKREAETLIRKGATLGNFVWLDSQDLAGVWKLAVRAASVFLVGVQREANEIKRTLANIPGGIAKPKAHDIATLERGQFYVCYGRHAVKTYVQPAWMATLPAREIALGYIASGEIPHPPSSAHEEPEMSANVEKKLDTLIEQNAKILECMALARLPMPGEPATRASSPPADAPREYTAQESFDNEALYQAFKARLLKEAPAILRLTVSAPEIVITEQRHTIDVDLTSAQGMLAKLIATGWFDQPNSPYSAWKEAGRLWNYKGAAARFNEQMDALHKLGFVTKEEGGYQAVSGIKTNIRER